MTDMTTLEGQVIPDPTQPNITHYMVEAGLFLDNGLWKVPKQDIYYTVDKKGLIERYYTAAEIQAGKYTPPIPEVEDLPQYCLACGETIGDRCKCTQESFKKDMMEYCKSQYAVNKRATMKYTDAAQRARNILIAKELGFQQDARKLEMFGMMTDFNGRPVKLFIDYREQRGKPKPIDGVKWGVYEDGEKEYLGWDEIDEIDAFVAYSEKRKTEDYNPDPGSFTEVEGILTLTGQLKEPIANFPLPNMSEWEVAQKKIDATPEPVKTEEPKPVEEEVTEEVEVIDAVPEEATVAPQTDLVPVADNTAGVVSLAVTPEEFKNNWDQYTQFRDSIQTKDDVAEISGKPYLKKSYWRKVATAFNLTDQIINEERVQEDDGFLYRIKVRATAPNGRSAEGVGMCDSRARKYAHPEHDVYATAHTRAKNRAISDLVGGGEVSYEEMH